MRSAHAQCSRPRGAAAADRRTADGANRKHGAQIIRTRAGVKHFDVGWVDPRTCEGKPIIGRRLQSMGFANAQPILHSHSMLKLGIYLNTQHPEADDPTRRLAETLEQARLIRALGFDSIWAGEHHVTPGFHFFPQLSLLQRVAVEAEGLWIGTNLNLLPLHNPLEVAEIGAFLDLITGGKFLLGVGLGYRPEEFAAFGVPLAERVSRLTEGVELLR